VVKTVGLDAPAGVLEERSEEILRDLMQMRRDFWRKWMKAAEAAAAKFGAERFKKGLELGEAFVRSYELGMKFVFVSNPAGASLLAEPLRATLPGADGKLIIALAAPYKDQAIVYDSASQLTSLDRVIAGEFEDLQAVLRELDVRGIPGVGVGARKKAGENKLDRAHRLVSEVLSDGTLSWLNSAGDFSTEVTGKQLSAAVRATCKALGLVAVTSAVYAKVGLICERSKDPDAVADPLFKRLRELVAAES
jgi:hypothetical protein